MHLCTVAIVHVTALVVIALVDRLVIHLREHDLPPPHRLLPPPGQTTFFDVDVPPSVAVGPAQLSKSVNDIADVIGMSSVLKLTASAAEELLQLAGVTAKKDADVVTLAQQLARAFEAPLTVLTAGMPACVVEERGFGGGWSLS